MIREFLAIAARAALEWALASLLLANGAAFCLIAAAAARLRLGPPCILCARVHRLLLRPSSAPAPPLQDCDALRLLLCHAHLAAVAAAPTDRCAGDGCGVFLGRRRREAVMEADDDPGMETHRVVSIGSEICEQDQQDGHATTGDRSDDSNGPLVSLFELAPLISRPREANEDSTHKAPTATEPEPEPADDDRLSLEELSAALRAQGRELDALREELASERRARAEAEEYQRQLEEQGELDREAARLAMQLVHESETEKHGLQRQLDACRVRAQLYQDMEDDGAHHREAEANGGGDDGDNNYQSLVDFLPGSVYSSSPDLANLLKLYTEAGNDGGRRQREDHDVDAPAIAVVEEEAEEEVVAVTVAVTAGTESSGGSIDDTSAIVADSLDERSTSSFHVEAPTEAA